MRVKRLTRCALLTAIALAIFVLEALLDNEGVSDVNIVSYNGSTLL